MADQKITQLNENTTIDGADLIPIVDDPAGTPETQKITRDNLLVDIGLLNMKENTELTISSGSITITQSVHTVDTESDAASDNLDTITLATERTNAILILSAANSARTVVVKNGTGNMQLAGAADFSLDHTDDRIVLLYDGSGWVELCRSNNS